MSIFSIQGTTAIQDLAATITRKLDSDGDGKLSPNEFAGFLTQLVGTPTPGVTRAADTSAWDTHAYPAPTYVAGNFGPAPAGFEAANWNDPNMQTPKYVIGRLAQEALMASGASSYNDQAFKDLFSDNLQKAYGGAYRYDGKDLILGIDGGSVDFIANAGGPNPTLWWNPL